MRLVSLAVLMLLVAAAGAAHRSRRNGRRAAQVVIGESRARHAAGRQAVGQRAAAGLVAGARLAPAQQRQHRDHPGRVPDLHRAVPRAGLRQQHHRRPALCRGGAAGEAAAARPEGSPTRWRSNAHAWLAGLADPTGAAQKNAALWSKDLDVASADFATGNLYALTWLLAQRAADAGRAGGDLLAFRSVCAGPRLDRDALPRHHQGGDGCRRAAQGGDPAHDAQHHQGDAGDRRGSFRHRSRRAVEQRRRRARCTMR